jgi:hypothetical protein
MHASLVLRVHSVLAGLREVRQQVPRVQVIHEGLLALHEGVEVSGLAHRPGNEHREADNKSNTVVA